MLKKNAIVLASLLLISCSQNQQPFISKHRRLVVMSKTGASYLNLYRYQLQNNTHLEFQGNYIYVTGATNMLLKVSAVDGTIQWQKTIAAVPNANLVLNANKIYFTTLANELYVLDDDTGNIEFIYPQPLQRTITSHQQPIFYGQLLLVSFNDGSVIIFHKETLKPLRKLVPLDLSGDPTMVLKENILQLQDQQINLDNVH
jgi:outer membrane protein assembly factor BamB